MLSRAIHRFRVGLVLVGLALATLTPVVALTGDPVLINEVLASHTGTDDTEFIELYGTPGTSLFGLSVIVVESDAFGPGAIDRRFDFKPFHQLGSNGFFLIGNCGGLPAVYSVTPDASLFTNYLENSSLTVALVETSSLAGSSVTGSEVVLDAVALTDGDAGDIFFFGAPVIGPDGPFFPAGARRVVDGVDTDTAPDWAISDFSLGAANTPTGGGFDGCAPIPVTIPEIQGSGQFSLYAGEVVTTTGVVTLISANGRDMWVQDPEGDGDPATSDGIFVDDRDRLSPPPDVGDLVMITGEVEELQFGNALPLTQIDDPDDYPFVILASGEPLPEPVPILDLPNESVPEAIDFWEPLEGMRVSLANGFVASPTSRFGEFVLLVAKDAVPNSGYYPQVQHIRIENLGGDQVDYNPERVMVDDSSLEDPIIVRPGDRVRHLLGVVDYTFGNYKIQPDEYEIKTHRLPNLPASTRSGPRGDTVVTTFNLGGLWDTDDRPDKPDPVPGEEELAIQLAKLALAIEIELELPGILVVQEVENQEILQTLGDLVNASAGSGYVATSFDTCDGAGSEVGFLWDAGRVSLADAWLLDDPPGGPFCNGWREPLIGVFDIFDEELVVIGLHLKSKGGSDADDPIFGINQPANRPSETRRKAQAQVVRDYLNDEIFATHPEALVLVTGDMNDFEFSEPNEGPDHPVAILEGFGDEVPMTNLLFREKDAERFTFVFDGNSQSLDHMLVSPGLLQLWVGTDILRFNTSFEPDLADDDATPLRASDHDPLEGRFVFSGMKGNGPN